jgi:hypothetical protein
MDKDRPSSFSMPQAQFRATIPGADEAGKARPSDAVFRPLYCDPQVSFAQEAPAMQDPEQLLADAHQKGLQEGIESGALEARATLQSAMLPGLTAFVKTLQELGRTDDEIQTRTSKHITDLALAIMAKILGTASNMDEAALRQCLQPALGETHGFTLNVHPDDYGLIQDVLQDAGLPWPEHPTVTLQANPAVIKGELRSEDRSDRRLQLDDRVARAVSDLFSQTHRPGA